MNLGADWFVSSLRFVKNLGGSFMILVCFLEKKVVVPYRLLIFFLAFVTALWFPLVAQDREDGVRESLGAEQGFYELEELINATVTVGSKKKEKATKTPAIVSVFTDKDIVESGYDNLYDLFATVPGVEIIESYYGQTMVLFRGVQQEHYNNKSLLVIDGHRIYEQTYGTYRLEQIPLNAIKRIEIIRGPGSALYGTNAYTGLINITTKKDFKTDEISIHERLGIFNDRRDGDVKVAEYAEVSVQKTLGENMSLSSHTSGKWYQPFVYTVKEPERSTSPISIDDYTNNFISTHNSFVWKNLDVNAFFFYQRKSKFGTGGVPFRGSNDNDDNFYYNAGGNIGYTHVLSDKLSISYKVFGDYYDFRVEIGTGEDAISVASNRPEQTGEFSGYKIISQNEAIYEYNEHYSGIVGLYVEYNHTEPFSIVQRDTGEITPPTPGSDVPFSLLIAPFQTDSFSRYDISGYLQVRADYDLFSLTGGFRYNYNKDYEHNYAPRGGLNFTLYEEGDHGLFLKALYGLAVRNPSFFEQRAQSAIIRGDVNLRPESIHSVDVALEYVLSDSLSLRSNYFYNDSDNFIVRSTTTPPVYRNTDGQVIHGVEIDIKYYPLWGDYKSDLWFTTNVSYRTGKEKSDNSDVDYLAPWLFNFRVDYKYEKFVYGPLHFSVAVKYVGERSGSLSSAALEELSGSQNDVADYVLVNLLIRWTFLEEWGSTKDHTVEFGVQNITDASYVYPESIRNLSRSVDGVTPFYPGRYFYIAYRAKLDL